MGEQLTPAQYQAVHNRGGRLLVSAAAGSGKTKVLVDRLLSYITDPLHPSNVDDFLIITYTKAAATELRGKIAKKLTEKIAEMPENRHLQRQIQRLHLAKIATVHSFCADILRENAYRIDVAPDFRVAEEQECLQLQLQVIEKILDASYQSEIADQDFVTFIDTQGFGRNDRRIPGILLQVYNASRCHIDPEGWLDECIKRTQTEHIADASETVWGAYLIADLHRYLDLQIQTITNCAEEASAAQGMEKAAAVLLSVVDQLRNLRRCTTWDEIYANKNIDYGRMTFGKSCSDVALKEAIKTVRDSCKKHLSRKLSSFTSDSNQVLDDLSDAGDAARGLIRLVRDFASSYNKLKKSRRIFDFSDLEHRTLDLLLGKGRTGPTSVAMEIGDRFREIMVDEYQDSNAVQDAIFSVLTQKRNNCFMVGDVKQSIYQFRLADPTIFLEKYNTFSPADSARDGQGRKVLLSSNFRSSGPVIEAVNDVFSLCMSPNVGGLDYGDDEKLYEGIPHIDNSEPEVELHAIQVDHDTYGEEASFVADRICKLLDGKHFVRQGDSLRPITADDIVILLRSPGSVGGEFAYALEQRGVRCITGTSIDLLQTEEISVLRALLQIISNPIQDIPLVAVLSSRVFRFTADDLAAIRAEHRGGSIFSCIKLSSSPKCQEFLAVLDNLRQKARLCSLSELIEYVFAITKIDSIFAADPQGDISTGNLYAFCRLVADCENNGQKELDQFLEFLDTLENKGLSVSAETKASGTVTIMSVHKSKGLEFPVVFLCGLSKSFNQENVRAQVLCDKELGLGLSCADLRNRIRYPTIAKRAIAEKMITEGISEEVRVLYVAMTRARDRLIMTYADKDLSLHLGELVGRMDLSAKELLTGDVNCAGTWVMLAALRRTEAGPLFALAGTPRKTAFKQPVWKIQVSKACVSENIPHITDDFEHLTVDTDILKKMEGALTFVYPHLAATQFPSKLTATQLKGRLKDQEIAENTKDKVTFRNWRKPSFVTGSITPTQYGNAVHALMQHIPYQQYATSEEVGVQLQKLVQQQYLTSEMVGLINCGQIAAFFHSALGKQLLSASKVLREFKFSILDDADQYGCDATEDQVLLQGVIDCAIVEEDGITVIDFKTDRILGDSLQNVVQRYREQVMIYAKAISRIYQKKIKSAYLYFFDVSDFYKVI